MEKNFERGGIIVASNSKEMHKNICSKLKKLFKNNYIN